MPQRRLLHVDSDAGFCARVRMAGEDCGYEVCTITDPHAFHSAYESVPPDLIVLEVVMPGIDGLELLAWLAQQNCPAPILVFSGYAELYLKAAEMLAQRWPGLSIRVFPKPGSQPHLRAILGDCLARLLSPTAPHSKVASAKRPLDEASLAKAVAGRGAAGCAPSSA